MSFVASIAVISASTSIYGAAQNSKARKAAASGQAAASQAQLDFYRKRASQRTRELMKMIGEGMLEFPTVDAGAAADQSLGVTTRNLPGVLANTAATYDSAASNFSRYLNQAFGQGTDGEAALPNQQQAVNDAVLSALQGRLSEGTRNTLGRRALATGAVNLGRGAVQDTYTQQLGIAAEEQVQRGIQAYGQLYETYGRFAPQISPLDLLNYGGLSTNSALQNAQFNATGMFQSQLAEANAILQNIDMATQTIGSAIGPAAQGPYMTQEAGYLGAGEIGMAVGQGLAGIGGAYLGGQMARDPNYLYRTGYRAGEGGARVPVYAETAAGSLDRFGLPSNYFLGDTEVRRALPAEAQGAAFAGGRPNNQNDLIRALSNLTRLN
jgi:type II secretory pathway pseudopilin PulG